MIEKAVAKLSGFGPQVAKGDESRAKGAAASAKTSLAQLFSSQLSTLGRAAGATNAILFSSANPLYNQPAADYRADTSQDTPPPRSDTPAAPSHHDQPADTTARAPHDSSHSDGQHDAGTTHRQPADGNAQDHGNHSSNSDSNNNSNSSSGGGDSQRSGDDTASASGNSGNDDSTPRDAGASKDDGSSTDAAHAKDGDGGSKKQADKATDAKDGSKAKHADPSATGHTTAQAHVASTPDLAAAIPGGDAHAADGHAAQTGKDAAADGLAKATEAVKSGAAKAAAAQAGTHAAPAASTGAAHASSHAHGQAATPSEHTKQATADPQTRARQGQQISEAIGAAGEGSKVKVKVATEDRGGDRGNGATQATAQAKLAADPDNKPASSQTGGQGNGNGNSNANQQSAHGHAHVAPQHATARQAARQQAQQVAQQQQGPQQAQNQQAAQAQGKAGVDATSATGNSTASSGANHSLASTGGAAGQAAGTSGPGHTQAGQHNLPTAQTAQAQRAAQTSQPVTDQVSVKILKAVQAGKDRIQIHLKPSELGRVDVKIELTHDGRATAVVTADKQDTLDLLRRDAGQLQKALADAGVQTNAGDLAFNLRGEQQQNGEADDRGAGRRTASIDEIGGAGSGDAGGDGVMLAHESGVLMPGRVDVRA